ncbi:caspase domain-containing protein [Mycena latifolia]|nr:caspase domain-containing protein [Mycena latifolia]
MATATIEAMPFLRVYKGLYFHECHRPIFSHRLKALLIGIRSGRGEGYPELKAAHADVEKMRGLLIDVYHYAPADICVLVDDGVDGHVQPTRDNILLAIAELVQDVRAGDHRFFHYSGHSIQVKKPRSESEEGGKDEYLIPFDGEEMKIAGKQLHKALLKPLPVGAHLVAVLDTCHSGSLLDLPHYRCNRVHVPWINRGKRTSEDLRRRVVRRGARLSSLAGAQAPNSPTAAAPTRFRSRGSALSVVCDPQAPGGSAPAATQVTWLLPEDDDSARQCESPVARFPCTGWCRSGPVTDADAPVADVIALSACKGSQRAWEDDDGRKSMTSSFVELLRANPNRSLRDLLERVSHATHTMAFDRHERAKVQKALRTQYVRYLMRRIEDLERERRVPFPCTRKAGAAWADRLAALEQLLRDAHGRGGYDMDAFQNPDLASFRPLDMDRLWQM